MYKLIYLLIIFPLNLFSQQFLMNESEIIKKNKVKSLTVTNCLTESSCWRNYYEFNDCGEISFELNSVGTYSEYLFYDSDCKLIKSLVYEDYDSTGTLFTISHYYEKEGKEYHVIDYKMSPREIDTIMLDTVNYPSRNYDILKDEKGRVTVHKRGTLYFPCGAEYPGENRFRYSYYENGLIKSAEVHNSKGEHILSLSYTYLY